MYKTTLSFIRKIVSQLHRKMVVMKSMKSIRNDINYTLYFSYKYRIERIAYDYKINAMADLHFLNELNKIFVFIASKSRVLIFIEYRASNVRGIILTM